MFGGDLGQLELTAGLRIVTPMFIGGAKQQDPDGIRPPSVKGALRFWWRAMRWPSFLAAARQDEVAALRGLHKREAEIFGAASDKAGHGQSRFLIKVRLEGRYLTEPSWPDKSFGSKYLGYGLLEQKRKAIQRDTRFEVHCHFRPEHGEDRAEIAAALRAWGLFGGLGSRARRGFGAVALETLDGIAHSSGSLQEYRQAVEEVLDAARSASTYPPYTAFSALSRFAIMGQGPDPLRIHDQVGLKYKDFRRKQTCPLPQRVAFGLPLKSEDESSRRGSPLFFHVHPLGEGEFAVIGLFLPALFHPKAEYKSRDLEALYEPVVQFLDLVEEA